VLNIELTGRVALVLGGSRGIGAGIVESLCRAGATTIFTHTGKSKHQDCIDGLVARVRNEGGRAEAVVCDALDAAKTTAVTAEIVGRHGRLDILVANVGQNLARPAEEATDPEWRHFLDMNLTTAFYGVRAVLPHMLKGRFGRIILIGSSAVYDGGGGAIDYAAAKAGLDGMMRYLTRNYVRKGILTNTIHPCVIDTDLLRERYNDEQKRQSLTAQVPAGRLGTPSDIGGLAAFLASSHGDFLCGQAILVDGGRTVFR
jgi:NAD(P)-dependent dehydrogenase (short-subunit alcohol dehydrogenase family)